MWRCLKGILPICINLIGRFFDVDPFCKRCGNDPEAAEHTLYACDSVLIFWRDSPIRDDIVVAPICSDSLTAWIQSTIEKILKEKHALFTTLL